MPKTERIFPDRIKYEVALELLGQDLQPFIVKLAEEREKVSPSKAAIKYFSSRKQAIRRFQNELRPTDIDIIKSILNKTLISPGVN